MAEERGSKWEGKATVELKSATPAQVWPLLEDFCNLHKWVSNFDTCYQVEGLEGQPGLVRYISTTVPSPENPAQTTVKWVKERLLTIDPVQRCFTYDILDNNMGFNSYLATFKVIPIDGDGGAGCQIQWSFVSDPVQGWRLEDLSSYIDSTLQTMAKKMEEVLLAD